MTVGVVHITKVLTATYITIFSLTEGTQWCERDSECESYCGQYTDNFHCPFSERQCLCYCDDPVRPGRRHIGQLDPCRPPKLPFFQTAGGYVVIVVIVVIVAACCAGVYQSGKKKKDDRERNDAEADDLEIDMEDQGIRMLQNHQENNDYTSPRHIRHANKYGVPVDDLDEEVDHRASIPSYPPPAYEDLYG